MVKFFEKQIHFTPEAEALLKKAITDYLAEFGATKTNNFFKFLQN